MQGRLSSHDKAALGQTMHSAAIDINIVEHAEWLLSRVNNVQYFWSRGRET
jgi:hypothetical protein